MRLEGECRLLRVFADTSATAHGRPLCETLIEAARKAGLSGATLFEGAEGFGQKGGILRESRSPWSLGGPKEALLEMIDSQERIDAFLESNAGLLKGATCTVERAFVVAGDNWRDFK